MRHFKIIKDGMDVNALALAIAMKPERWESDTFLRKYPQGPFGDTHTIMLRFPNIATGLTDEQIELYKQNLLPGYDQHESVYWPGWDELTAAHDFVFDLARFTRATRIGRVMINRVRPGGHIFRHADTPEHVRYWRRFHLVIQGAPGAVIHCGEKEDGSEDEALQMLTGRLFWFRNELFHEVRNESGVDRISMVIDLHLGSTASPLESPEPEPPQPRRAASSRKRS
ncbi:aspartyl/asparaginyl beta-hydroxylase domain-containing protein [Paraburkholderia bengalensis]|uniref:Aspartyl/asparaginyl beta-hydroxylase domain-containing protein n=1 Tax=Paraburkholderia bengalensis TaxID=2747562 RepID=A0ABU8IMW1_9BURK